MSDDTSLETPSDRPPRKPRSRLRRAAFIAAIALVAAVGGAATSNFAHGWGHRFHHGPSLMRLGGPIEPAEAAKHAERAARHFAIEVDATKDQEQKLIEIAKGTVADLLPLREKVQAGRARGLDLLGQPTVDRSGIEALRGEQMANAEAFSRRVAQALGDAAEVLTPEQRTKLAERIKDFRERGGWFRRWRRG